MPHLLARYSTHGARYVLVIICSLHTSVDGFFDQVEYKPYATIRFDLVLYRPFPYAENVAIEALRERQRDAGIVHVARAHGPKAVDGLQGWGCPCAA